jgi:hypothetical protein
MPEGDEELEEVLEEVPTPQRTATTRIVLGRIFADATREARDRVPDPPTLRFRGAREDTIWVDDNRRVREIIQATVTEPGEEEPGLLGQPNRAGDYTFYTPTFFLGIVCVTVNDNVLFRCGCLATRGDRRPYTPCDWNNPHPLPKYIEYDTCNVFTNGQLVHGTVGIEAAKHLEWKRLMRIEEEAQFLRTKIQNPTKLSSFTRKAIVYYVSRLRERDEKTISDALQKYTDETREQLKKAKK